MRLVDRDLMIANVEGLGEAVQDLACSGNTYTSPIMTLDDESGTYTVFDQDGYPLGYIGTNPQGKIVHICPHVNDLSKDIFAYYQNEEAEEYEDEDIMADIFHP